MSQPDADRDDATFQRDLIHRAELRRQMLERVSEVAMEMVETMGQWAREGFTHPQENWVAGFPRVSRAVRLTLVLQARIDAEIVALRKGRLPGRAAGAPRQAACAPAPAEAERTAPETPEGRDERTCERLSERDDFDGLLAAGFDACLAAIHADLGLNPEDVALAETGDRGASPPPRSTGAAIDSLAAPSERAGGKARLYPADLHPLE